MFGGYVAMFRGVYGRAAAADRLGRELPDHDGRAGGVAAVRGRRGRRAGRSRRGRCAASGMRKRPVADKTISFLVLTYFPYAAAVIVCGFGLHFGLFSGPDPISLTIVPADRRAACLSPSPCRSGSCRRTCSGGSAASRRARGASGRLVLQARECAGGVLGRDPDAIEHLRSRDPALLGAILFWAFQIAVLWAAFHAFGDSPPLAVLVQGFFIGMLGNLLPIPGGVGGVEGGMVGAYSAFGVDIDLALVAVLVFRAFTFWLPLLPGVVAYFRLRRTVDGWKQERARRCRRLTATLYKVK